MRSARVLPRGAWPPLRALRSPALPAVIVGLIAAAYSVIAVYDIWRLVAIAVGQVAGGPAFGSDFLNLYAGAALFVHQPQATYRLDEQMVLQRALTGWSSPLVPFYLPPYAAAAVGWLGWLPYGLAYLVWLVIGIGMLILAAYWLAPRWTRWYPLVWGGLALLFLPVTLGLVQGQTSALMLASFAAFVTGFNARSRAQPMWLVLGLLGWTLKPQLAPALVFAMLKARRGKLVIVGTFVVLVLGLVAWGRLGSDGLADYRLLSEHKLTDALWGDPTLLLGPTLLHASHWFLGVNVGAHVVAALLTLAVGGGLVYLWRSGPAGDDALLLQLASLPIVAVVAAPYALVHELTVWLASFWLLWRYTASRPGARAALLWLSAGALVAGNQGVTDPLSGSADYAGILGLGLLALIAWLFHGHATST
jgi:hypothetical protein